MPRDFQFVGINHMSYNEDTLLVVNRRTADGKSLIPQVTGAIRRKVNVTLVPLIGLGSDQVEKGYVIKQNMESYHIDEHKWTDSCLLCDRLLSLTDNKANHVSIQLIIGPKLFTSTYWLPVLEGLVKKGLFPTKSFLLL